MVTLELAGRRLKDLEIKQKRVLIVDDEPPLVRILSIKLRVCGYEVITASGGQQAIDLAEDERPDLVLLDIIMPDVDGFQVLERLRPSGVPVIALSARPENATRALALGAREFLPKPFDIDDLVRKVDMALASRG